MKLFKTWQKWLEYYHKKYGIFEVQNQLQYPKPWVTYGTKEYEQYIKEYEQVTNRKIFADEIPIDIDTNNVPEALLKERLDKICNQIITKLKQYKISFTYFRSGGKGRHFHLFFNELKKYTKSQQDLIKKIFKQFLQVSPLKGYPHICMGNPTLIQLEMAQHRKGGKKTIIDCYDTKKDNVLPKEILETFEKQEKKYKETQKQELLNYDLTNVPKEIHFLENGDFYSLKDGRYRAAFVLLAYYSHFLNDQELFDRIQKWNEDRLNNHLSKRYIQSAIRSIRNKTDKKPLFPQKYLANLFDELGFDLTKIK